MFSGINGLPDFFSRKAAVDPANLLADAPASDEALHGLALAASIRGCFDLGVAYVDGAIDRAPQNPVYHKDKGMLLSAMGRHEEAIHHLCEAARLGPDDISIAFRLAELSRQVHDEAAVRLAARSAVKILIGLTATLKRQGNIRDAQQMLDSALTFLPCVELHKACGNIRQEIGQADEAIAHYEAALALAPADSEILYAKGQAHRDLGQKELAERQWLRVLAIEPTTVEPLYMISTVHRYHAGDAEALRLQAAASRIADLPAQRSGPTHFALAKLHEDVGQIDQAFAHYSAGNALWRSTLNYNADHTDQVASGIVNFFSTVEAPQIGGNPSDQPIFVVGMPRSGTSLVEQILSSHPEVHGIGEVPLLVDVLRNKTLRRTAGEGLPATDFAALANCYLDRLRSRASDVRRIVDKVPGNFFFLGFINLLLPNARIIHCVRDPLDTCWSCYKTLFTEGQEWSGQFDELGRYYLTYRRMMDHWRRVLPGRFLELRYEELVGDFEPQVHRLVDYCGLDWHDGCLEFYKTRRSVRTASATQVRRPIHNGAIGQWRPYAEYLEPLAAMLRQAGCDGV